MAEPGKNKSLFGIEHMPVQTVRRLFSFFLVHFEYHPGKLNGTYKR